MRLLEVRTLAKFSRRLGRLFHRHGAGLDRVVRQEKTEQLALGAVLVALLAVAVLVLRKGSGAHGYPNANSEALRTVDSEAQVTTETAGRASYVLQRTMLVYLQQRAFEGSYHRGGANL